MPAPESYELHIDAFTPETIPMGRLAEYMGCFAELLGNREHVHFRTLEEGSLCVSAGVEAVAVAKVDRRVEELRYGGGPQSARRDFRDLDDKLAEDGAVGRIPRGRVKVIEFAGRTRAADEQLGPVEEAGSLDGEVILIGGRDETIQVHLRAADQIHVCVTSKQIARRLAAHLLGNPVRLEGRGTWARSGSGAWTLKTFAIEDFRALDETPLTRVFEGLRACLVPPAEGRMNPVELMRQLQGGR